MKNYEKDEKNGKTTNYIFDQFAYISYQEPIVDTSESRSKLLSELENILHNSFTVGAQMKKMSILFEFLLGLQKKKEFFLLPEKWSEWFKKGKKIETKSSQGLVFNAKVFEETEIVLKFSKNKNYDKCLIREYYIGKEMNCLRYNIPNFVYTLGIFISQEEQIFIAYEKIPGLTLKKALSQNNITFADFINIFLQVLLALEIAQRLYSFCHYDLHADNVILRPIEKPYKYSLSMGNNLYTIVAEKYIPVFIDFGLATIQSENEHIGSISMKQYGIFPCSIQGVDMYKLLFYSYIYSTKDLQRQIGTLFLFYGCYDPYKILVSTETELKLYSREYLRKIVYSRSATFTPLEFTFWLSENYQQTFSSSERKIYYPINSICSIPKLINCSLSSYIMLSYLYRLLKLSVQNFTVEIASIRTELKQKRKRLIARDKKMLARVFKIKCIDKFILRDRINNILNISIDQVDINTVQASKVKKLIHSFIKQTEFMTKIFPYFQYLYTMKELQFEKIYENFLNKFTDSPQYILYSQLGFHIEKARRWAITLMHFSKKIEKNF